MKLHKKTDVAARILKCSPRRVRFDPERLSEIKEAVTKFDFRNLIKKGAIRKKPVKGISKFNVRKNKIQKSKGRQKGHGSRKGKATARTSPKREWMNAIRAQRKLIKNLRDNKLIDNPSFYDLYRKAKGGFFRSTRHIKLYVKEQNMIKK